MQHANSLQNCIRSIPLPFNRRTIKLLIIVFLFARITQNLAAKDWSISVTPIFSVGFGTIGEYVYINTSSGKDIKLSELDWDVKPSLQYGGRVGVSWKALAVSGFAFGAVPMRSGAMKDSDWLTLTDLKTTYSVHENALASSYSFGGRIAYTFKPLDFFSISPFIGTDYVYISMKARNGRGWNGYDKETGTGVSWDYPAVKQYRAGDIDYMREEVYTHTGISFDIKINKFLFALSIALSPYTYMQSLDWHQRKEQKNSYYIDIMHGWFSAYRFGTEVSYLFNKSISISLSLSWTFTRIIRGVSYDSDSLAGPWRKASDWGGEGGASRNTAEISIGCTYRFLF